MSAMKVKIHFSCERYNFIILQCLLCSILCFSCVLAKFNNSELLVHQNVSLVNIFNNSDEEFLRFATPCETPNHEPSFCVEISQCPVLSKVASKLKYIDFINASRCGPKNENTKDFKVCCGKYNSFRSVSKQIDNEIEATETVKKEKKVFPKNCGTQRIIKRGRIVGGTKAALGEFPWIARIINKNDNGFQTPGCAGFLIHPKYVVTAAHCVDSEFTSIKGKPYSVILGEHNVETKIDCSPGGTFCADPPQVIGINKMIMHSNYSKQSKNHHNDIALINLITAANISAFVQPICLLTDSTEKVKTYYISGWGKTEDNIFSSVKMKVNLLPYDKDACKEKYQMLNLEINDDQICAGGERLKDSCNGDSGGPLMMSPNGTQYFAAGLVSYGIGCGMEDWPGVYTSIPSYVSWIESEILKNSLSGRLGKTKKAKDKKNKVDR